MQNGVGPTVLHGLIAADPLALSSRLKHSQVFSVASVCTSATGQGNPRGTYSFGPEQEVLTGRG